MYREKQNYLLFNSFCKSWIGENLETAALTLFDADPRIDAVEVSQQGTYGGPA